ncbi:MAG: exopolysaccharide biosynthesis polyprenyl glycosylphosphotransferase [Chloroflexi bacterium]|nr:exopolysaccharide biosynthesis polyprenyl glycosylphosphotransferase [Chloroflexota bacterium]
MSDQSYHSPLLSRLSIRERKFILFLGDVLVALLALLIALITWARGDDWLGLSPQFFAERPENWFYLLPVLWLLMMAPIYDIRRSSSIATTLSFILIASLLALVTYLIIFFVAPPKALPRRGVAVFLLSCSIFSIIWRMIYIRFFTLPKYLLNTLIVGAGKAGSRIAEIVAETNPKPFNLIGFIDDDPEKIGKEIFGVKVLGPSSSFYEIVDHNQVSQVIMAISNRMNKDLFETLTIAEEKGLIVTTMPSVYENILKRVPVYLLGTDWMVRNFYDQARASAFYEITKRLLDIFGGLVGTLVFLVLLPVISLVILIDSGAPIFYKQDRLGLRGIPFTMYKLRTMVNDAEADGIPRPAEAEDVRITRSGNFLRRSHLDEMPQFFNVLRGDLSLVGPRAERHEIVEELQKEIPFYRGRLLVRPGVTGWAQINYGYASGAEQNAIKLEYDLYYIKNRNTVLDLSILLNTFKTIFGLKGR